MTKYICSQCGESSEKREWSVTFFIKKCPECGSFDRFFNVSKISEIVDQAKQKGEVEKLPHGIAQYHSNES